MTGSQASDPAASVDAPAAVHRIGASRERIVGAASSPSFTAHRMVMAGMTDAAPEYEFMRERPERCQILATVAGSGQVLVEGAWRTAGPQSIYITPIGVRHAYRAANGRGWSFCWVVYARAVVRAGQPALLSADCGPLRAAITGLLDEVGSASDPAVLRCWTELVHAQVARVLALSPEASRLWPIWRACDEDLGRAWTLAELARIGAMSAEHLRRLCRAEVGRSPMRHLAWLRLRAAATMLATDPCTVDALAKRLGYGSAFALSAAFKRATGVSPSAFRSASLAGRPPPAW